VAYLLAGRESLKRSIFQGHGQCSWSSIHGSCWGCADEVGRMVPIAAGHFATAGAQFPIVGVAQNMKSQALRFMLSLNLRRFARLLRVFPV
jgi:hypothetical protein